VAARVVAAARTVVTREDRFKWKTTAAREADARAAAARAATRSLVLLFVQLLLMKLASKGKHSSLQKGKTAVAREAGIRATASREAADHATAAVRAVAAREGC
jgi:hypothetical protein